MMRSVDSYMEVGTLNQSFYKNKISTTMICGIVMEILLH